LFARLKNLYHSSLKNQKFDAIVIGSGLGGLTTAVLLAKAGKSVLVLEKHYVPGGFTHTFKRKKMVWDVGVHYVGQMSDGNGLLRKSFDYLTDNKLKWADIGDVYDQVIINGDIYDFVKGIENQTKQMIGYFPNEEVAIRKYFDLVEKVASNSKWFFGERAMPYWLSNTLGYFFRRKFYKYSDRTTYDVLRELTSNEKLIAVLASQCGNYGLTPKQSSFGIHAMVVEHFIDGGNYPVGGASSIHKYLIEELEKHGGELALKADVKNIIVKNNKAIGVLMQNGDQLFANKIVSNAGAHNTFKNFIGNELKADALAIKDISPSLSHVCLYIGLDVDGKTISLPKNNIWIYEDYDFDNKNKIHLDVENGIRISPLIYISFPSEKDPDWNQSHPGTASIQVIGSFPYHWIKQWEEQKWQKRDQEYETMKIDIQNLMLEKLYSVLPQVKNHITQCELSTPLSTKHFSSYAAGEIYGLEHTPKRFRLRQLRAKTKIKNLYLTGQDIVCVGVGSAMFSGIITSVAILNRNLMWKILRYKNK